MRDPSGPPMWLLWMAVVGWMIALGVWAERHRFGGTHDLRDDVARLTAERNRLRDEVALRRRSSMTVLHGGLQVDSSAQVAERMRQRRPRAGVTS